MEYCLTGEYTPSEMAKNKEMSKPGTMSCSVLPIDRWNSTETHAALKAAD